MKGKHKLAGAFFRLMLFSILCLQCKSTQAKIDGPFTSLKKGNQIAKDSIISVADHLADRCTPLNPLWRDSFFNAKITDRIRLGFIQNDVNNFYFFPDTFTVWVELSIDYQDEDTNHHSLTTTLSVRYNPNGGQLQKDQNVFEFYDGIKFTATITKAHSTLPGGVVPPHLELEAEILSFRYYTFHCEMYADNITAALVDTNHLQISWAAVANAKEYDLEWCFVEKHNLTDEEKEWNFLHNSNRVSVEGTNYVISLIYPEGYIIYRVRAVGEDHANPDQRIAGAWTWYYGGSNNNFKIFPDNQQVFAHFEQSLNWRYECSFAEGGKKKESIAYFDGSLRSRQSVTAINTLHGNKRYELVQYPVYDHYGRPTIQVLPTPYDTSTHSGQISYLGYITNFYNNGINLLSADDILPFGCEISVRGINPDSSEGKYYSANNPLASGASLSDKLIPDAEGYPFTVTEYTPDKTGRVNRQGGAGPQLNVGTGHETQYYYSTPQQDELDRLFGTEVGYASHYKKIVTKDPNGQLSITYKDMADKVIATALTGDEPQGMAALSGRQPKRTEENLMVKNVTSIEEKSRTVRENFFVSSPNSLDTLQYMLDPNVFNSCTTICATCVYDLTISVLDACGDEQLVGGSYKTRIGSKKEEMTCDTSPDADTISWPALELKPLDIGNYTVIKTLTINDSALDFYTEKYIEKATDAGCIRTFDDYKDTLDHSGCGGTCVNSACEITMAMMLEDVSPGGQYGQYMRRRIGCTENAEPLDTCEEEFNPWNIHLSVLNDSNWNSPAIESYTNTSFSRTYVDSKWLPSSNWLPIRDQKLACWRNPAKAIVGKDTINSDTAYFEEDSVTLSKIYIIDGYPEARLDATVKNDDDGKGDYIFPQELNDVKDFIRFWKPSWARALIKYHPEYCHLQWCLMVDTSRKYDEKLLFAESYEEARDWGLIGDISSEGLSNQPEHDPFYNGNIDFDPGSNDSRGQYLNAQIKKDEFKDTIQVYRIKWNYWPTLISMWEVAWLQVKCPGENQDTCELPTDSQLIADINDICIGPQIWKIYRSLYFAYKQKQFADIENKYETVYKCFSECIEKDSATFIGDTNLTTSLFKCFPYTMHPVCTTFVMPWPMPDVSVGYKGYEDPDQPCWRYNLADRHDNWDTFPWKYKMKRFPGNSLDLLKGKFQEDLQTNLDPHNGNNASDIADLLEENGNGDSATAQCNRFCDGYDSAWTKRLRDCAWLKDENGNYRENGSGQQYIRLIVEDMKTLCKKSCEDDSIELKYPLGASTLKEGSTIHDNLKSFDDIIAYYYLQMGNTGNYRTAVCDADLITMPPPRNVSIFGPLGDDSYLDKCACDKFLLNEYKYTHRSEFPDLFPNGNLPENVTNRAQLFAYEYGVLPLEYERLKCACEKVYVDGHSSQWVPGAAWSQEDIDALKEEKLPVDNSLICPHCAGCSEVQKAYKEVMAEKPEAKNSLDYATLIANAMNRKLGMTLVYEDYKAFLDKCDSDKTPQADQLLTFARWLFDNDTPRFQTSPYQFSQPSLSILGPALYPLNSIERNYCKPYYELISLTGDTLEAVVADNCAFDTLTSQHYPIYSCTLVFTLPSILGPTISFSDIDSIRSIQGDPQVEFGYIIEVWIGGDIYKMRGYSLLKFNKDSTISGHPLNAGQQQNTNVCGSFRKIDTCYLDKMVKLSDKVVLDRYIERSDAGFIDALMLEYAEAYPEQYLEAISGPYGQTDLEEQLTFFFDTLLKNYYLGNGELQHFNQEALYEFVAPLDPPYDWAIPVTLTCEHCNACDSIQQFVSRTESNSQEELAGLIRARFGENLKMYSPVPAEDPHNPGMQPACATCDNSRIMVCDATNQAGLALEKFLNALAENQNLGEKSVDLQELYFKDPFVKTQLYRELNLGPRLYAELYGAQLRLHIVDSDTFNCSIVLTDTPACSRFLDYDSLKNLRVNPTYPSGNKHFLIDAYYTDAFNVVHKAVLKGYSDCYTIASCCEVSSLRLCNKPVFERLTYKPGQCDTALTRIELANANKLYNDYIEREKARFRKRYIQKCLTNLNEQFTLRHQNDQYHYTLYYYDQAGNLTKTVPPKGVKIINLDSIPSGGSMKLRDTIRLVRSYQLNDTTFEDLVSINHTFRTTYKHTTLNKVRREQTPDAGVKKYWYDAVGRPVLSRDAKQGVSKYNYTLYDGLGRAIEGGQLQSSGLPISDTGARNKTTLRNFIANGTHTQITHTVYDNDPTQDSATNAENNLRSRVAAVSYNEVDPDPGNWDPDSGINVYDPNCSPDYATHYVYDPHGLVNHIWHQVPELEHFMYDSFSIHYDYDLISGNVKGVRYQETRADQYFHWYRYDEDNRLTDVYTSRNGSDYYFYGASSTNPALYLDAHYEYYLHGPLSRMVLGREQVQGLDYAYNLQGWLKGVNANALDPTMDIGRDGDAAPGTNMNTAIDAYAFTLGYFEGDFNPIGLAAGAGFESLGFTDGAQPGGLPGSMGFTPLYNGNIRARVMALGFSQVGSALLNTYASYYQYDQLNRLKKDSNFIFNTAPNPWVPNFAFDEEFAYDPNGNITDLVRYDGSAAVMDQLQYNYSGTNNRLQHVIDPILTPMIPDDIEMQPGGNYGYDANGNLTKDMSEGITKIDWNTANRIRHISYGPPSPPTGLRNDLAFRYGADGNRIVKIEKVRTTSGAVDWKYTYHIRDAHGNIMATYARRLEQRLVHVNPTDYDRCIDTIINHLGITNFRNFIACTYQYNTDFINALRAIVDANDQEEEIVDIFPPVFYALNDGAVWQAIIDSFSGGELVEAAIDAGHKNKILDLIFADQARAKNIITQELTIDCGGFLNDFGNYSWNDFYELYRTFTGRYPWEGQNPDLNPVATLCNYSHSDIADEIITSYSSIARYLLENDANLHTLDFEFMKSLLGDLYVSDESNMITWLYSNSSFQQRVLAALHAQGYLYLLQILIDVDPHRFIIEALNIDIDWAKEALIDAGININDFMMELLNGHLSPTVVEDIQRALNNGQVGNFKDAFTLSEWDIYGSSRVGVLNDDLKLATAIYNGYIKDDERVALINEAFSTTNALLSSTYSIMAGAKSYELTDQLGNVMVTISDKKILVPPTPMPPSPAYFKADILTITDHYAFGSQREGREYAVAGARYRFGFNGQEKDNEISGEGNNYSFKYRIEDSRLGRFLSVDPLASKYPFNSPYAFAENSVIAFVELEGLERAIPQQQQNAIAAINRFANDQNTTTKWTSISKQDFVNSLTNMVNNPASINQRSTNLCGVAIMCKAAIEYSPEAFVDMAISLYQTGSYGDIKANPFLFHRSPSQGLDASSYVTMSSIRQSLNYVAWYFPENDWGGPGFTRPEDIPIFLTQNMQMTRTTGNNWPSGTSLVDGIINAINSGDMVSLLVHTDHFRGEDSWSWWPDHYIEVTGITNNADGTINVDWWSWGRQQSPIRTTSEELEAATYGNESHR